LLGDFEASLAWEMKSMHVVEAIYGQSAIASADSYSNVAWDYYLLDRYDDALAWYQKAKVAYDENNGYGYSGIDEKIAQFNDEVGVVYMALGDFEQSLKCLKASKELFEGGCGDATPRAIGTYYDLGRLYEAMGNQKKAEEWYGIAQSVERQ
jgi:tetratricopeptide (TPR) repeat protein